MKFEEAVQQIHERITPWESYLEKSRNGNYCCPLCGSGRGPKQSGAVKYYRETDTASCHSCGRKVDVIDAYMDKYQKTFHEAVKELAESIGITVDKDAARDFRTTTSPQNARSANRDSNPAPMPNTAQNAPTNPTAPVVDFSAYYNACRQRLGDPRAREYLNRRGISFDTADEYLIGFDPEADPAKAPGAMGDGYKPHPAPRMVFPCSPCFYVTRCIDDEKPAPKINSPGTVDFFNKNALNAPGIVFVTEGVFDALSLMEVGASAISLNSKSNADRFVEYLASNRPQATLALCLDNDENGEKGTAKLRDGLTRLNIDFVYVTSEVCGEYNDPNDRLQADRAGLIRAVNHVREVTSEKPDNTTLYINSFMLGDIERFKGEKKTGFANLDAEAGGLYGGLYVLAAPSSLGKTTFALQLSDQLAANGHDVVFFSLEQSRLELVSKSMARTVAQINPANPVSSLAIRKGFIPDYVRQAGETYKEKVGDRVSIVEGNFNCTVSFIGDYLRRYITRTGVRPVVVLDYLQLLQPPEDKRQTTKEVMDNTVTTLKRISREMDLTIIAISSVNRANYLAPIDFESLKESGSIEYTADVVWGLQYTVVTSDLFDAEKKIKEKREKLREAKNETPRQIELVCLKNRYGRDYSCRFEYYPASDLYKEVSAAKMDFSPTTTKRRI